MDGRRAGGADDIVAFDFDDGVRERSNYGLSEVKGVHAGCLHGGDGASGTDDSCGVGFGGEE